MRNFLLAVFLIIPLLVYSQIEDVPNVKCYDVIPQGSYTVLDSLHIECGRTLLIQDNAILVIKGGLTGDGEIRYGDIGDDTEKGVLELLPQTDEFGNRYYDYRPWGDDNPKIIFESCVEGMNYVKIGEYIDVEYLDDCKPDVDGNPHWSDAELAKYECVVYNVIGQELHRGKFGGIYGLNGKVKSRFLNHMILIRINVEGKWVYLKRLYVNF